MPRLTVLLAVLAALAMGSGPGRAQDAATDAEPTAQDTDTVPAPDTIAPSAPMPTTAAGTCKLPLPPDEDWSPQEAWAWEKRICLGKRADLREFVAERTGGTFACDPRDAGGWPAAAGLTSRFFETILRQTGYLTVVESRDIEVYGLQSLIPNRGIEVFCARIVDELTLDNAEINRPLVMVRSRFDKGANLRRMRSSNVVIFHASVFDGPFKGYAMNVDGDLLLQGGSVFNAPVQLISAHVGGNLETEGAQFLAPLVADNIRVDGSLRLRNQATFRDVRLHGAQVGLSLSASDARFDGTLTANASRIGGNVHLGGATFGNIDFISAKVGGVVQAIGTTVQGVFDGYDMTTGGTVFLRNSTFLDDVNLSNAAIGGSLELRGSAFSGRVSLTNAVVSSELHMTSPLPLEEQDSEKTIYPPPQWADTSELVLRNLRVQALQDTAEAWTNLDGRLDLVGFAYEQLGGLRATKDSTLAARDVDWLLAWLKMQKDRREVFNPQPYEQLARVLKASGYEEKADRILYAKNVQKMFHATTPAYRKAWLGIMWLFIGFGLKVWVSLVWLSALVVAGAVVVWRTPVGRQEGLGSCLFYSVDMAVPFLALDPSEQTTISSALPKGSKYFFGFQRGLGLVLASFLAAGMSGLAAG